MPCPEMFALLTVCGLAILLMLVAVWFSAVNIPITLFVANRGAGHE